MAGKSSSVRLIFYISLLWVHGTLVTAMRVRLPPEAAVNSGPPNVGENMVIMGDMAMTEELYEYLNAPPTTRKVILPIEYKWPFENGFPTVPYKFNVSKFANEIRAGMAHWETHTCIKFREMKATDKAYLEFINGNGCWSFVGRLSKDKKQQVSIGNGCSMLGTVVHEIGHAIGFIHEQMRPDRDTYLQVNLNNVDEDNQHNFKKFSEKTYVSYGVLYDYTSVMQYGGMDFSSNGKLTMATKEVQYQGLLGRGQVLTHRDKRVANIHYGCIEQWKMNCSQSQDACQNQGYLGKNCKCVCPSGTGGELCQIVTGNYYYSHLPPCNQVITSEKTFNSPNYPSTIPVDTWCVYKIQAPEDHVVEVRFLYFSLDKYTDSGSTRCATAFLEVRDKKTYEGTVACGKDIAFNQTFVSNSRDMVLYLDIPYGRSSKGFQAQIKFFHKDNAPDPYGGFGPELKASASLVMALLCMMQVFAKYYY